MQSPQILPDHRLTFRIWSPRANEVALRGDWVAHGRGTFQVLSSRIKQGDAEQGIINTALDLMDRGLFR